MLTAVLLSGGLDSAVLLADEAARGDSAADLRERRPRVGSGRARDRSTRCSRAPRCAAASRPLVSLAVDMRDVYAADALGGHRHAAGVPHAGRRRVPPGPQHRPARRRPACSARRPASAASCSARSAHNPFPDATPEFRAAMATRAVARAGARIRNRRALRAGRQGRGHPAGRGARRPVRADAVVHEPGDQQPASPVSRCRGTAARAASAASDTTRSWRPVLKTPRSTPAWSSRAGRPEQSAVGSRQSAVSSRQSQSAVSSRQSAVGSQQSAVLTTAGAAG